ncbi:MULTISPECIES: Mu transposase C-terminal domain-containing protein [unclassified Paenibacillus]|uniref:Mu transposase C-terminal domain-containing protein n=1 Tax=unclassified Paenibacillus TaxID=185978 RepID=UPI00071103B5|nr:MULTISPECIES: Mu transposase C-terminal domain-containing protein [unclassified Paenibacillus]KQX56861.1 hypothetical protein ASD40_05575 [Paenibacillus sp. Root444D2]KRE50048.1 hypothetical protein ASG85_21610 [Paenibacillus sp. Soil724D2]
MSFNQLKVYDECSLYGKKFKVITIDAPNVWLKRPDGEDLKITYSALINHPTFIPDIKMKQLRKESREYENALAKLDEKKRDEVSKRFEIIQPLILLDKIKNNNKQSISQFNDKFNDLLFENEHVIDLKQEDLLERIKKKHGGSRATIMRYLKNFRDAAADSHNHDGMEGLISNKGRGYTGRKDNKLVMICHPDNPEIILDTISVRQSEKQIEILKETIENDYLTKYRVSKAYIHGLIERRCAKKNEQEIKYSTVSDIIDRIDEKAKERLRNMKKAKAIYDEVARGYADRDADFRLDIVQIDHTQLDMQVIDDATGLVIDRPWITLGICVHSRMPWCFYLSHEGPSSNVVRKAIQHGVFVKNTVGDYGTDLEWEAFGIPNIIYVDNGMDFKSTDIKRLVNETLESEIMHRPVKTPHYGSVIERLFGTINTELIHNILGTTKSNIFKKGDLEPEKDAVLTLDQLRKILIHYLTDIYQIRPHRGLGNNISPVAKYRESVNEVGYPEWIFPGDEEKYKIDFMLTKHKPYTRDGVRWDNKIYKSKECEDIIGSKEKKYTVKYDLDDISKIYLLHPKKNEFIVLFCETPPYETIAGVNQYTYKKLLQALKKDGEEKLKLLPGKAQMHRAWERIEAFIREGIKNKKSVRQIASKMTGIEVSVTSAFQVNQTLQNKITKSTMSLEDELYLAAKKAEEIRRSKGNE